MNSAAFEGVRTSRFLRGWLMVGLALLANALCVGNQYLNGVLVEPFRQAFNAPTSAVLLATSGAMTLGFGVLSASYGWLSRRCNLRLLVAAAMGTAALGYGLLSHATALWHVAAIYGLLFPVGYLGGLASANIVVNWFTKLRGRALGLVAIGVSMAGFVLPPLAIWSIEHMGWRMSATAFAILAGLLTLLVGALIVDDPKHVGLHPDGTIVVTDPEDTAAPSPPPPLKMLLRSGRFWALALVSSIPVMVVAVTIPNLITLAGAAGQPRSTAAMLMSLIATVSMVGHPVFGWFFDVTRVRVIAITPQLLLLAGCLLLLFEPSLPRLVSASALLGAGTGGAGLVLAVLGSRIYGAAAFGRVAAIVSPLTCALMVLGLWVTGGLFDLDGDYDRAMLALSVLLGIGVAVAASLNSTSARV